MKKLKTILSSVINLLIRVPLILLSNCFWGLSKALDQIGDGFDYSQKVMKTICLLPILSDIETELKDIKEKDRKRLLKRLKDNLDF